MGTRTLQFDPSDRLVLHTDGIIDAENSRGEFFGVERFENAIRSSARGSAEETLLAILAHIQEFAGRAKQFDDIALVVSRDSI